MPGGAGRQSSIAFSELQEARRIARVTVSDDHQVADGGYREHRTKVIRAATFFRA